MNLQTLLLPAILLLPAVAGQAAGITDGMSGMEIMEEVQRRQRLDANIYEEQSIILVDGMGNRDTRTMRRYLKTDSSGSIKCLLLFDSPSDVYGTALLATKYAQGEFEIVIYLPASGGNILQSRFSGQEENMLGTDFSFDELIGEVLSGYQFVRREQKKIENVLYVLVDVYEKDVDVATASPTKRHFVHMDNYYITRTDYLDRYGRLIKQQTLHDLKQPAAGTWRAGMVLMENYKENHTTLIKINRRIFSEEYVPDEVFTVNWLYQNQPPHVLDLPVNEEGVEPDLIGREATLYPARSVAANGAGGR